MESKPIKIDNSKFQSKWESKLFWAEITMGSAFVIFVILFCVHQPWLKCDYAIDTTKWGTFGDFIGGVIGTACAYISLRLLVKNLKEQEKANEYLKASNYRSSEVYELQLVHKNISSLSRLYRQIINGFKSKDGKCGVDAMNAVAKELYDNYVCSEKDNMEKRIEDARKLFDAQYITHRDTMAVYYRLLYQIFQIIWQSELKGDKKALLSKMQRSQFAENELLLLRYNCLTPNGMKMRFYVNQFNLLKHLPLSHLLEFKKWVKDLDDVQRNRLDTECVALKKCIKNMLIKDGKVEVHNIEYSKKYQGKITIPADKKECHFELVRYTKEETSEDITSMDQVLDKWDDQKLRDFFVDFFMYVFDYSNFSQFNNISELSITHDIKTENNGKKHTIWTLVRKDKSPLIVSMPQDEDPQN